MLVSYMAGGSWRRGGLSFCWATFFSLLQHQGGESLDKPSWGGREVAVYGEAHACNSGLNPDQAAVGVSVYCIINRKCGAFAILPFASDMWKCFSVTWGVFFSFLVYFLRWRRSAGLHGGTLGRGCAPSLKTMRFKSKPRRPRPVRVDR